MPTSWSAVLAQIERDLCEAESAFQQGRDVPVPEWSPPTHLGPMPTEFRDRARRLLQRHEHLQEAGRARLGDFTQDLSGLKLRHEAASAYAVADQSRG